MLSVTVFSKPNRPQCRMTYLLLDKPGSTYRVVDVTEDLGYSPAPVVVVGQHPENHWSEFRQKSTAPATHRGNL